MFLFGVLYLNASEAVESRCTSALLCSAQTILAFYFVKLIFKE